MVGVFMIGFVGRSGGNESCEESCEEDWYMYFDWCWVCFWGWRRMKLVMFVVKVVEELCFELDEFEVWWLGS